MSEQTSAESGGQQPRAPRPPRPIVLWRLHGATDDLRVLAIETSFGYALGLELDAELVWLRLQPDLERLVEKAHRIESALIAQRWQLIDEPQPKKENS